MEGIVLFGNSTNNTSIIEQSCSIIAANRSPKSHIIPSVPVTTSNHCSAFRPLENPANLCDFIESINLTEEEVTTDSSVKLRPRSNMKTRRSVPAQNKKQQVLPRPQQQHVGKISNLKIIDYEIDYPPIPSNSHKNPKTSPKKKFYIVGDSHVKRVIKHIIDYISHKSTHLTLENYDGDSTKVIKHNMLPILHDKHPDGMISSLCN